MNSVVRRAGSMMAAMIGLASAEPMPKEDVIDVPAVGNGFSVSNVFQTNMVLQRDKPLRIWGWAEPGETVRVAFAGRSVETKAGDDRAWSVTLDAVSASSAPQTMTIEGDSGKVALENILVGDVWILGGQSNMEFPLDRIENGELEIISANYPNIRILTVPAQDGPDNKAGFPRLHEWSSWFGTHYRKGDWDVCTPEVVRELSAIGYVFARRLHMAAGVPIGVIDASRGGTTVETWTPDPILRQIDTEPVRALLAEWDQKVAEWDPREDLENRVRQHRERVERLQREGREVPADEEEPADLRPGPAMDQNRPGNCHASMIAPLAGLSVKGAIFHQGYNNCFNGTEGARLYRDVFPRMIAAWRNAFQDPGMPFGILSLCTEGAVQTPDNFTEMMANAGPYIREAQYQTFLDLWKAGDRNIGFASTYDLRRRWYHPQLKIPAGERIARWALATQYGFENQIRWKPPMVTDVTVEDGRILVHLDEPASAVDDGSPIMGFAVAGEDRRFHPATADHLVIGEDERGRPRMDNKVLVLTSPMVPHPVAYRYAWARSPLGNLQADRNTDIPFATQRNDDWPMEAIPLDVLGDEPLNQADRGQRRRIEDALRQIDLERRLFEAGTLLESQETQKAE